MTFPEKSVRKRNVYSSFKHSELRVQHGVRESTGQVLGPGFKINNVLKNGLVSKKFASI